MHWNIIYGDRYRARVYPPLRPRQPPLATWASTDDPLGDNVRRCVCSEMWLAVWVLAVSCDWLCGCGQWAVIGCLGVGSELWLVVLVLAVSCDWLFRCRQWAVVCCHCAMMQWRWVKCLSLTWKVISSSWWMLSALLARSLVFTTVLSACCTDWHMLTVYRRQRLRCILVIAPLIELYQLYVTFEVGIWSKTIHQ